MGPGRRRPGVWIAINGAGLSGDGLDVEAGGCSIGGLAIEGFGGNGMVVDNPDDNPDYIGSCYIGTDTTGLGGAGNGGNGILIVGPGNMIVHNVIANSGGSGIDILSPGNSVSVNDIGVDVTGQAALPNSGAGVLLEAGADDNTIGWPGGGYDSYSNVISGNLGGGVCDGGSNANTIAGNIIGLGADGSAMLGNQVGGVLLSVGASDNSIGPGNLISGNAGPGVGLSGGAVTANEVVGNLTGTDSSGSVGKPNQAEGVLIDAAPANTIGGSGYNDRNVISGNTGNGITITDGAEGNLVATNLIGTDESGTVALGNSNDGVYITSNNNTVGTTDHMDLTEGAGPTIISGNSNAGIDLAGDDNQVGYCYVGTDGSGLTAVGNGGDGIDVEGDDDSIGTELAMFAPLRRIVISGNAGDGISETGKSKLNIYYCYIGVDRTGLLDRGNGGNGILLDGGSDNTVEDNVISCNLATGVGLNNESGDKVLSNIIGLGSDGSTQFDQSNTLGLSITGRLTKPAANNTIGAAGAGNIISGNGTGGVLFLFATSTVVQGNYIGTDQTGTQKRQNGGVGLFLSIEVTNNTIGGSGAGQGNIISGNTADGISLFDTTAGGNLVQGNYIGTDKNGTAALGNGGNGMTVSSSDNAIGGNADDGEGNVISGNGGFGIFIRDNDAAANVVQGNCIGVGSDGKGQLVGGNNLLGNGRDGIRVFGFCNVIGGVVDSGSAVDEGNVISGNGGDGVYIGDGVNDENLQGGVNNQVLGNWIGLDGSGAAPLGNLGDGVDINDGAWGNTIGGTSRVQRNVISGNGSQPASQSDNGVFIANGAHNNYLWNNYIGTDEDGTAGVGNWGDGVYIEVSAGGGNEVGGAADLGNVISANGNRDNDVSGFGIDLTGATLEDFNIIGWNKNGQVVPTNKLPNKLGGAPAGWRFGTNDNTTPL